MSSEYDDIVTPAPAETEDAPAPAPEENGDPFADWPQAESGAVIEDVPEGEASVEHVAGEIEIPAGYTVFEGTPRGDRRSVAAVASRFNGGGTNQLPAPAPQA